MKDRKNLILLIIFLAFFAIMLPMVSIPVDIGEHTTLAASMTRTPRRRWKPSPLPCPASMSIL